MIRAVGRAECSAFCFGACLVRNSIHTPRSSLYTPLKITIDENTNLPLNLLNTPHLRLFLPHFFLSSAHPFLRPKCVRIVRIGENGVEK